jgi:uncharacterized membrane protein
MRAGFDVAGWGEFASAYALFMVSHAIPARPAVRRRLVGLVGERAFLILYSLVSLALLAWLILSAGRAPHVTVWAFAPWQLWVPVLVMPLVCALAAFGVAVPNPLSFGARNSDTYDPDRPGIAGIARHPLLWAIALWAGAHLIPNGDLAHVVLFGGFAGFALAGMAAIDRRKRRSLGPDEWSRLAARTSFLPFAALIEGRWRPSTPHIEGFRAAAAALLYVSLIASHAAAIGVSPLPILR